LIALKGSPLGFGTDLAGSSRIPAAFNGLYALKTTEGRLSQSGLATVLRGLPIAAGSLGILSQSIDGLAISFKAILESKPWLYDPEVAEIPWRQDKFNSIISRTCSPGLQNGRLTFGILSSDDFVEPHPTIGQAIAIVKKALQHCGYEVSRYLNFMTALTDVLIRSSIGNHPSRTLRSTICFEFSALIRVNASAKPLTQVGNHRWNS